MNQTRLRKIWSGMHYRCGNCDAVNYAYYGGRGISVSFEWMSFDKFYTWALASDYADEKWLDRINNDGDYGPDNCRWVTPQENANNRSSTKFVTAWGERKSMFDWTQDARCKIDYAGLKQRLRRRWSPEKALTTPVCRRRPGVGWVQPKEAQL